MFSAERDLTGVLSPYYRPRYLNEAGLPRTIIDPKEFTDYLENIYTRISVALINYVAANEPVAPMESILVGDNIIFYCFFGDEKEIRTIWSLRPEYDFTQRELIEEAREMVFSDKEEDTEVDGYTVYADISELDVDTLVIMEKGLEQPDKAERVLNRPAYRILEHDNGAVIFEMKRNVLTSTMNELVYDNKSRAWSFE